MNSAEAIKIYDYLFHRGREGAPLLTIARETKITSNTLRKYFRRLSKSFVQVGSSPRYALNSFNLAKDQKKYLLDEIEKYNQKQSKKNFEAAIAIGTAVFISVIVAISNGI